MSSDPIYVLLQTNQYVISVTISGQISIFQKTSLKQILSFQIKKGTVLHACSSEKYIAVAIKCNEINFIEIFQINQNVNIEKQYQVTLHEQVKHILINQNDQLIIISKCQNHVQEKKQKYQYQMNLFSLIDKAILKQQKIELENKIIYIQNNQNLGIILTQNNYIVVYCLEDLTIISKFKIISEPFQSIQITDQNEIYLCPQSNQILKINCSSLIENPLPDKIDIFQSINDTRIHLQTILSDALRPNSNFLKVINNYIFSYFDNEFIFQNYYNISQKNKYSGIGLSATCISVNQNGDLFAVGDFLGQVQIFRCKSEETSDNENHPIRQIQLQSGIRCLDWLPSGEGIVIGTLDGSIIIKQFSNGQDFSNILQIQSNCSITSLKFRTIKDKTFLLATNSLGQVIIFEENQCNGMFSVKHQKQAHLPQASSSQFGTLDKYAEIWSSVWGLNGINLIATSSEDTTVKIYKISNDHINLKQTLNAHKLAVTSIDWKKMSGDLKEIFASCSDDQTIVIYDPQRNFEIVSIFSTSFIKDWHTLTYISLEENGTRVAVGSQNGYLFIIDLVQNKFIFAERVHLGGIEGVIWKKNKIFTCSNDCNINVINLKT
ncbi:WD domain, G-beta repeat protein (macronuclear) [Tetrahymena thermophila SB210]|uniref:WD domain, G-beta repeat protein n=1 Tax=Tetrahymena thermophila (strain SB210) TaxID=312017 RepID=I7M2R6_TETTS|nr:WD domain, G-beta repeat protein [Tetrahymena thermophila SB210]EAS01161.2 WD domain, G-beta repeat protein [Tetrahymena thermophila SB210]|eukprot:XP_001021406.2 WD domain, G-beta repeat protein [Tetrahymena thermophila SB210]